jgi:hypothetical protein
MLHEEAVPHHKGIALSPGDGLFKLKSHGRRRSIHEHKTRQTLHDVVLGKLLIRLKWSIGLTGRRHRKHFPAGFRLLVRR